MILGTAVKISTTTVAAATSATITVRLPNGSAGTSNASMTDDSGGAFSYIYQSTAGDAAGLYKADVKAATGSNFAVDRVSFQLED